MVNQKGLFSYSAGVSLSNAYLCAVVIRRLLTKSAWVEGLWPGPDKENPGPKPLLGTKQGDIEGI